MLSLNNVRDIVKEVLMRILPVFSANKNFVNSNKGAHSKLNKTNLTLNNTNMQQHHQYTGVASADLAYASMFDSAIAQDLKLMGLI